MKISLLIIVLAWAGVSQAQPAAPATNDDALGNAALAERMCQYAQTGLMTRQIVPATLHQAIEYLEAANKLNPDEPRFLRLLTEAYLQLGGDEGRDGAKSSLTRYLKLVPADLSAQMQLIDIYYGSMERGDVQKKYLDGLLAQSNISAEVKSHIAVMAAKLAQERTEDTSAKDYLDQALKLMPLNPEALRLKFRQVDRDGTALDRITLLFQMLRANPAQPGAMLELASELADAGMVDPSLNWYRSGFDLNSRLGMAPDPTQVTAYTAELLIADQTSSAQGEARKLLDKDPSNVEAALISLLVDQRGGNAEKIDLSTSAARSALLARLGRISSAIHGGEAPATQPTTAPDLDIAGDVKKLQESSASDATTAYAGALADLAWLEIYFNNKPADAQQYLAPLSQLVPPDSVIMARLQGWSFLVDGKNDEARVKLSAVADRDPLAALGMLRLDKDKPASVTEAAARKLLSEHASGVMGAMLMEALRSRFGLMPTGPDGAAIRSQVEAFPMDWLDLLDFSKARNFYSLKADGYKKVVYDFGEPMLAQVTLTNISKYDITIGPEGAIHPDLWFDVKLEPVASQNLIGVALDRISQKVVLHPRESIDTILRVDQGQLSSVLQNSPNLSLALFFSVLTNPLSQQGGIAPGPDGYREQFSHTIVRNSTPPTPEAFKAAFAQLQNGASDVRVRTLDLLGAYALLFNAQPDQQTKARATELADFVRKSTADPTPSVRAVATYITALLSDAQVKEGIIRQMLSDPWYAQRMLGLAALQQNLETAQIRELAKPLAQGDPDPMVKQLAAATIAVTELAAPTTAPTTGPATQDSPPAALGGLIDGANVGTVGK